MTDKLTKLARKSRVNEIKEEAKILGQRSGDSGGYSQFIKAVEEDDWDREFEDSDGCFIGADLVKLLNESEHFNTLKEWARYWANVFIAVVVWFGAGLVGILYAWWNW